MNTIKKEIKNKDNTDYKLIRFSNSKSIFNNSIFGSDIGIHSKGFTSIVGISSIIAVGLIVTMLINFRI